MRGGQEEPVLQADCCTTSHAPYLARVEAQREVYFVTTMSHHNNGCGRTFTYIEYDNEAR